VREREDGLAEAVGEDRGAAFLLTSGAGEPFDLDPDGFAAGEPHHNIDSVVAAECSNVWSRALPSVPG